MTPRLAWLLPGYSSNARNVSSRDGRFSASDCIDPALRGYISVVVGEVHPARAEKGRRDIASGSGYAPLRPVFDRGRFSARRGIYDPSPDP